jgi:hypothetical protein
MTRFLVQVSPFSIIYRIYYELNLIEQDYLLNKDNRGEQ